MQSSLEPNEEDIPRISVKDLKANFDRNVNQSQKPVVPARPPILAPKPNSSSLSNKIAPVVPPRRVKDDTVSTSKPPLPPRKPPSSLTNDDNNDTVNTSKPPLPPRNPSSLTNSDNDAPPIPSRSTKSGQMVKVLDSKKIDQAQNKVKSTSQDMAGQAARRGVSQAFAQSKAEYGESKYGKKVPDGFLNRMEKFAQNEADKQAQKAAGEAFDDKVGELRKGNVSDAQKSKASNNANNGFTLSKASNMVSNTLTKSNSLKPSIPPKKTSNTEIKIPRRPIQHNNPFKEHNLSQGIKPDAKERYETVFEANKDDDGYIDGAVVKEIYVRSRLDNQTLCKIWELLDTDEDGRLSKNEFSVGMFLIDERLRGNPVPDELPEHLLYD
ncbi:epidermal growth factor receptor substrate 15-like 1 [Gigaspora margarita]|uniref:Epidermal growth factor receptor substrate 15-like 1 n=1 Tax=Gigaspora margarita TaxID=4874 RepID=A0A8H4ARG6_GIGMA|nr:epidermal growth factor receptor substrate 15-like 1 [Gigaspora margarita]